MKKVLILFSTLYLVIFLAACGETAIEENSQDSDEPKVEETTTAAENENNESEKVEENTDENMEEAEDIEKVEEASEPEEDDVPREHQNALQAAQNYVDMMPFSEKGLFEQLTSEYGDQYPEDAAQYAIKNVDVDYNEEALESAINYQEIMPMSDQELLDQLISEYGEQFTQEQAQYALDNLPN